MGLLAAAFALLGMVFLCCMPFASLVFCPVAVALGIVPYVRIYRAPEVFQTDWVGTISARRLKVCRGFIGVPRA